MSDIIKRLKHFQLAQEAAGDRYGSEVLHNAANEIQSLQQQLSASQRCDCCLGEPISGKPCICEGTGSSAGEKAGLRAELSASHKQVEGLREALENIVNPPRSLKGGAMYIAKQALSNIKGQKAQDKPAPTK